MKSDLGLIILEKIQLDKIYSVFMKLFRTKRMKQFFLQFNLTESTSVLDVGGYEYNWTLIPLQPKLVLLNLAGPNASSNTLSNVWLIADGRYLPFKGNAFDIVYSNSVIEHLGTEMNQFLFANECRRVGMGYYIQTPNKWFPIEPHYIMFFIHWFPPSIQRHLIRNFSVRGWLTRPSQAECDRLVNEIRLLQSGEVQQIFPEAEIWREKIIGITKSLIAINNPNIKET